MMSTKVWIEKRRLSGGGRAQFTYHLRWVCPTDRRWRSRRVGTDRKVALVAQAKLQDELEEGSYKPQRRVTWSLFVEEHLRRIPAGCNRDEAERTLRYFGEACRPETPKAVTFGTLEAFVEWLRKRKNTPATINKRLRYVRAALNRARDRGYVTANPMGKWRWEREEEKMPRALSGDEKSKVLDACPTHQWRTLVFLGLQTGCRISELLGLVWRNVDFDNAWLVVTATKGKKDRLQPLPPEALQMLRELQASTLRDGGPFKSIGTRSKAHKAFQAIVTASGIAACTFHDLRRTFCTDLARAGVNQLVCQKLAGHASSTTTARYYQAVDDEMKRAALGCLKRDAG